MPLLALCVCGSDYTRIGKLPGTVHDLGAVVRKCESLGFEVQALKDFGNDDLHAAIETFVESVQSGDTVFVYFSGHGVQFEGDNYFVPVDYSTQRGSPDPERQAFPIFKKLIKPLLSRHTRLNYIALDACRDEVIPAGPLSTKGVSTGKGLLRLEPM
jgi:uncharacterized caspase-like protein